MQRRHLIAHIEEFGCQFLREGGRHSVYVNALTNVMSTIPRHTEINAFLVRKICKDLGVAIPKGK
jgi:mRNA interferase HicA